GMASANREAPAAGRGHAAAAGGTIAPGNDRGKLRGRRRGQGVGLEGSQHAAEGLPGAHAPGCPLAGERLLVGSDGGGGSGGHRLGGLVRQRHLDGVTAGAGVGVAAQHREGQTGRGDAPVAGPDGAGGGTPGALGGGGQAAGTGGAVAPGDGGAVLAGGSGAAGVLEQGDAAAEEHASAGVQVVAGGGQGGVDDVDGHRGGAQPDGGAGVVAFGDGDGGGEGAGV